MNILHKYLFLLLILVLNSQLAESQQDFNNFEVFNYTITDHEPGSQIWSIVQDDNGVMYFGSNMGTGILKYDGVNWDKIENTKHMTIRSLAIDSLGTIYVGGTSDFGHLALTDNGSLIFKSFKKYLPSDLHFNVIWKTLCAIDGVYFYSEMNVYRWSNDSLYTWNTKGSAFPFLHEGKYYQSDYTSGINTIEDDKVVSLNAKDESRYLSFTALPFSDNKVLIGGSNTLNVYNMEKAEVDKSFQIPEYLADFIQANFLYDAIRLKNGDYLFNTTEGGGSVLTDSKLNLKYFITQAEGLKSDIAYCSFEDKQGNLWLGTEGGIHKIKFNSSFYIRDDRNGLNGLPMELLIDEETLYVATSVGLNKLVKDKNTSVEGVSGQSWSLHKLKLQNNESKILVGSSDGLFDYDGRKTIQLLNRAHSFIVQDTKYLNRVLILSSSDFDYLEYTKKGGWTTLFHARLKHPYPSNPIIDADYNIWYFSLDKDLIKLNFKENEDSIIEKNYAIGILSNILYDIKIINNKIIATSDNGIYYYDKATDGFIRDTILEYQLNIKNGSVTLIQEYENEIWLVNNENGFYNPIHYVKNDTGMYLKHENLLPELNKSFYIDKLVSSRDSVVWIINREGLIEYNIRLKDNTNLLMETLLNKVIVNNDSVIFGGNLYGKRESNNSLNSQNSENTVKLSGKINSLLFKFASPNFIHEDKQEYQYYLKGFDSKWSPWTKNTSKEYSNLKHGQYVFVVRSKNIYGSLAKEAVYKFEILPPWYKTILAQFLYAIIIIILVFILVQLFTIRLINQKNKLEELVNERTAEIKEKNIQVTSQNEELMQQKEEILAQKNQILSQHKELAKLSIVASESTNAIMILEPDGKIEWINKGMVYLYNMEEIEIREVYKNNYLNIKSNPNKEKLFKECVDNKISVSYESVLKGNAEGNVFVQTTLTPVLDAEGNVDKVILIDTDLTNLKVLENYKNLMTQMIVHDLKNPLNSIIGLSSIQKKESELSKMINTAGYRMLNLVENILDVQKYQDKKLEINLEQYRLEVFLEKIKTEIDLFLYEKREIVYDIVVSKNTVLKLDGDLVQRVIINLITNANKYSPEGSKIIIKFDQKLIQFKNYVQVSVQDFGTGIPNDLLDNIFDEYWQIKAEKMGVTRSTGLGLTFCKMVIDAHKGKIWAESELEKGSTFYFNIPLD